jgi:hypothetical protein
MMNLAQHTAHVHHDLFVSQPLRTDFVMIVQYALVRQTLDRLEISITDTPALGHFFDQSSLP